MIFRFVSDFRGFFYSCPMLEVLSAVTGESFVVFDEADFAEGSVKALKQRLAQKIGVPRFRLRLLQDNCPLDDNQTLFENQTWTLQVIQLVKMEFLPPDMEQDHEIMVACEENDDKLLEKHLSQPPMEVSNAYCYCLKLVPTKTKARQMMEQRLF